MAKTDIGKVSITVEGAWSASKAYEALSMVSNNGSSYISKTDVPSGTLLTDTDYWMQIASAGQGGDLSNYYTKSETDSAISTAIGGALNGSY